MSIFVKGDLVLLENKCWRKADSTELQALIVGPMLLYMLFPITHKIDSQGQSSAQNKSRLKLFNRDTDTRKHDQ